MFQDFSFYKLVLWLEVFYFKYISVIDLTDMFEHYDLTDMSFVLILHICQVLFHKTNRLLNTKFGTTALKQIALLSCRELMDVHNLNTIYSCQELAKSSIDLHHKFVVQLWVK